MVSRRAAGSVQRPIRYETAWWHQSAGAAPADARESRLGDAALMFVYAAITYNAWLAIANAANIRQSFGTVALVEILILGCLGAYLLFSNAIEFMPVGVILVGLCTSFYVTCASLSLSVDSARDAVIIGLFSIVGARISGTQLLTAFRIMTVLVLAGLILEMADLPLYAQIFAPASYYANTRGITQFSLDNSGLFRNALGYHGRFSFGLSDHRTASLFIEQVSLANFAGVLCIFLVSRFGSLRWIDRLLHLGTVVLILLTNDTRTSTTLALISFLGYFIYPLLPASSCLAVMPAIVATGYAIYVAAGSPSDLDGPAAGDDLIGRIAVTMHALGNFDLSALLGFQAQMAPRFMDSGYAFAIVSSTLIGLLLLWVFAATVVPGDDADSKRCLFAVNVYLFVNLMIGGTAVFSVKVGAPLWLLVGFFANRRVGIPAGARVMRRRARGATGRQIAPASSPGT